MIDAMVIGSGPAGLSAALTLGRARRTAIVLDHGAPRNAAADAVHNVLSRDGTPPAELRRIGIEQLAIYPTVEVRPTAALRIETRPDGTFVVELGDSESVAVRGVVLATGVKDILPPVEGLAALWGRSVFHCPYCHGYEIRDQRLAVLGNTGPMAHLALHLQRFSADVVLCTNGDPVGDEHLQRLLEQQGITVEPAAITRLDASGDTLRAVVFADGRELERDAMFAASTLEQRSDLAAQLGCRFHENGFVDIGEFGETSIPGVYAVGDMAHRASLPMPFTAVAAAAASGTIAGTALDKELLAADLGLPNPFTARPA